MEQPALSVIITRRHHMTKQLCFAAFIVAVAISPLQGCRKEPNEVQRPERIVSMREIIYDSATYAKLAQLWHAYYDAYPSEDAYANWMYACRYASPPDYRQVLDEGLKKYPANPTLLYLSASLKRGKHNLAEDIQLLERATALDPAYLDPWHSLVVNYMEQGDREKVNVALRRLLEGRAVEDAVMDYSYNMLISLDQNAILITNGDNDTYPGWILTKLLNIRADVEIVNRSCLNADWYSFWIMKEGVPTFTSRPDLDTLEKQFAQRSEHNGLLGDTLLARLIGAADRAGRPVYFAATVQVTPALERFAESGRNLGLVKLVTPAREPYPTMLHRLFSTWIRDYRTGGLDGWQLRYSPKARASRFLVNNYGAALASLMNQIGPDFRLPLFRWYRAHVEVVLQADAAARVNATWCTAGAPAEIREWCKSHGYKE